MRTLLQPSHEYKLLTCYAMIMDHSIANLIDYKDNLDLIATRLGWAPVRFNRNLINEFWPQRMILNDAYAYDASTNVLYDPEHGIVPMITNVQSLIVFFWYREGYHD